MFDGGGDGWRAWISWRAVLQLGFGLSLVAGLGATWAWTASTSPAGAVLREDQAARVGPPPPAGAVTRTIEVFVSGAVASPGMYRLPAGLRVADAIAAAGGLLPDADPARLPDLAARLSDGKQVKVPPLSARSRSGIVKLDLNTASAAALATIPGVDAATAEAIVAFRDSYGPFTSLSDLHSLLGFDTSFVLLLRRYLTIGSG